MESNPKLTIVIPARNEVGLTDTLESLYRHSKGSFEVIIVNDCSDTDKWVEPTERDNQTVLAAYPPVGFGGAIQMGVDKAKSDNIYICGARTRFTKGWVSKVVKHINAEPETLFCVTNPVIKEPDKEISQAKVKTYGATITLRDDIHWMKYIVNIPCKTEPEGDEVDCAYGGSYAMKKQWWEHIRGLDMIDTRGGCNQFLSLKTWMAGGKVKVMKDVIIGNIYREYCSYPCGTDTILTNRVMIMGALFGMYHAGQVVESFREYKEYPLLKLFFGHNYGDIAEYHNYMKSIKKGSINNHLKF